MTSFHSLTLQEHTVPSIPHKDYLPDITGPEPESDYEHEDEQGGEEEYDDLSLIHI